MNEKKPIVWLGMSGGVDSSVSAVLLKEQGYDVVGVYIKGWYPDFLKCTWRDDRRDAMRVAAALDIPFKTVDASEAYKTEVVEYLIAEYKAGRTPNPDIMCNRSVKFGVFYQEAIKAGADYIATGHYARVVRGEGRVLLKKGNDENKDQSYFLWAIEKESLAKTLFPIGEIEKPRVREIAQWNNLATATKPDSQGVCFLGNFSMKDFLKAYINLEPGDVLSKTGQVIGSHDGSSVYTLGQRHGFTLKNKETDSQAYYVVEKDIDSNTITVDTEVNTQDSSKVLLTQVNQFIDIKEGIDYEVRFRYRGELIKTKVKINDDDSLELLLRAESGEIPTAGQSAVLYLDDVCVGGGIITV